MTRSKVSGFRLRNSSAFADSSHVDEDVGCGDFGNRGADGGDHQVAISDV
jgi:hypothetical protein